jgi:hypothetical protein
MTLELQPGEQAVGAVREVCAQLDSVSSAESMLPARKHLRIVDEGKVI